MNTNFQFLRQDFWKALGKTILKPTVKEDELAEKIIEVKRQLPVPVFWLLGKTQAGKTSIIRALTGRTDAEIGNGFQPCTRTARIYDFPDSDHTLLHFLDSRGLGEVSYDPDEDMQIFNVQAHVLIVVLKATDHAQQRVIETVKKIHASHPAWPLIVVQTQIHLGYSGQQSVHIEPYPFTSNPWPGQIPVDLQRSLLMQRSWFEEMDAHFVVVDFTLPEDGFTPVNYGLDAFWETLETILPIGLQAMMMEHQDHRSMIFDLYAQTAHSHIIGYALLAGGVAATPAPFVSTPLVLSVQGKMIQTLASIYHQPLDAQRWAEMTSALGVSYLLRLGGRELAKLVPGYGSAVASLYTAVATYALGKTIGAYFTRIRSGDIIDKVVFENIYQEELFKGRDIMKKYFQTLVKP